MLTDIHGRQALSEDKQRRKNRLGTEERGRGNCSQDLNNNNYFIKILGKLKLISTMDVANEGKHQHIPVSVSIQLPDIKYYSHESFLLLERSLTCIIVPYPAVCVLLCVCVCHLERHR